jgi:hypothetical protein
MRWLLPLRTPRGARVVAGLVGPAVAAVLWLVFHQPVGAIMVLPAGILSGWSVQNRLPSRWWYAPAGAAFLAGVLIPVLGHGVGLRAIGELALAAGISLGVSTFGVRVTHDSYAAGLEAADLRESEKAPLDT